MLKLGLNQGIPPKNEAGRDVPPFCRPGGPRGPPGISRQVNAGREPFGVSDQFHFYYNLAPIVV